MSIAMNDIKNTCLDILLELDDMGYTCSVFPDSINNKHINIVIESHCYSMVFVANSGYLDSPTSSDAVNRVIDYLGSEGYQKTLYREKTHYPLLLKNGEYNFSGSDYINRYEWRFKSTIEDNPF